MTVVNSRRGRVIVDTEALFIPFRGQVDDVTVQASGEPGLPFGVLLCRQQHPFPSTMCTRLLRIAT
jgi:hypothetical protein